MKAKRGFRFWIRLPVYLLCDFLGIQSNWDKANLIDVLIQLIESTHEAEQSARLLISNNQARLDEIEKSLDIMEQADALLEGNRFGDEKK